MTKVSENERMMIMTIQIIIETVEELKYFLFVFCRFFHRFRTCEILFYFERMIGAITRCVISSRSQMPLCSSGLPISERIPFGTGAPVIV